VHHLSASPICITYLRHLLTPTLRENVLNRKTLLATAAMAAFAASATSAQAQSSVTLYGLVDAGISYVNHSAVGTTGSPRTSSMTTAWHKAAVGACAVQKTWAAA
jgi:hypothetical protein